MEGDLDVSAIISIIGAFATILGVTLALVKLLPELRKTKADTYSQIAEASESIAAGAKVSNEFLRGQINDLMELRKKDIEDRRREKEETDKIIEELKRQQIVTDKLVAEQRREIIAWQDWAKRLNHQLISVGETPVPFKPKPIEEYLDRDFNEE